MSASPTSRLPRYKRAAAPPAMQFTDRDESIVDWVYQLRFATQEQIRALLFSAGAQSSCKRRLTLLYHNRYLDRRLIPLRSSFGSNRAVYCLDRRGAQLLALGRKTGMATFGWRPADNDRELYFLEHLVASNDVRVAVTLAAANFGMTVEWTDERQLRIRSMRQLVHDPKQLGQRLAVVPDGHFTLAKDTSSQGFALELDRGTVEERPFKEKVRALGEWKRTGEYQRVFRSTSLRVLFVVASNRRDPYRLARIKAWTEAEGGESLFWFTNLQQVSPASVLTEPIWQVAARAELFPLFHKR